MSGLKESIECEKYEKFKDIQEFMQEAVFYDSSCTSFVRVHINI